MRKILSFMVMVIMVLIIKHYMFEIEELLGLITSNSALQAFIVIVIFIPLVLIIANFIDPIKDKDGK